MLAEDIRAYLSDHNSDDRLKDDESVATDSEDEFDLVRFMLSS